MVHFTLSGSAALFCSCARCAPHGTRVTPFGHPRIKGHVHLPAASRSLSRPSSPCGSTGIRRGPMIAWPYPSSRPGMNAGMRSGDMVYKLSFTTARKSPSAPCSSASPHFSRFQRTALLLSFSGWMIFFLLENRGLEPLTLGLQSRCSSQLS